MPRNSSEKEIQAWIILIFLALISIAIIILKIQIGIIHLFQDMFWVSLVMIPLSLFVMVIFIIWGIIEPREENTFDYYYQYKFFTKPMIFIFACGFFVLSVVSFLFMSFFYSHGYSDNALQDLAEYQNELDSLQTLQSIFTGQIIWDIQNQIIEETINNLCKDPNYPCSQVNQNYQIYKGIKGAKDSADEIADFFGFINKLKQR